LMNTLKTIDRSQAKESKTLSQWSWKLLSFIDDEHIDEVDNQCLNFQATTIYRVESQKSKAKSKWITHQKL
jgi:hypothetical protein